MNCEAIRNELMDYVNGTMKRRMAVDIEKHLELCRDCRNITQSYRDIWLDLGLVDIEPPIAMRQNVEAKISKYVSPPAASIKPLPRWLMALAAGILIIVIGWVYQNEKKIPNQAAKIHLQTVVPAKLTEKNKVNKMVKSLLNIEPDLIVPRDTTLIGSKISQLDKMITAQVMYQYQGVPISLFIWNSEWPNARAGLPKSLKHPLAFRKQGQSIVVWQRKSLIYCLVADLQPGELAPLFGLPTDPEYSP